jgi:cytochrome c553
MRRMTSKITLVIVALACVFAASIVVSAAGPSAGPPPWAYGFETPAGTPPPAAAPAPAAVPAAKDPKMYSVPGATKEFKRIDIANQYGPADWFPGDHPTMPEVVAHGRKDAMIAACSLCHYPNGKGRQENAGVSGLPVSYFIQTMHDFRDGLRKSSDPRKANTNRMISFAKNMTDEEIKQAADYFGAIPWNTQWMTKVVETNTVPKIHNANGLFLAEGDEKVPIAGRLLETPVHAESAEILRDPHDGFIVYVPPGSLKKGEALVTKGGNGKTIACAICHGDGLRGSGPVPPLAGRSPSYLARQLYDMQSGARHGEWTSLMKPVVEKLTDADFVAITGYIASLKP